MPGETRACVVPSVPETPICLSGIRSLCIIGFLDDVGVMCYRVPSRHCRATLSLQGKGKFSCVRIRNSLLNPLLDGLRLSVGLGHDDEKFIPSESNNKIALVDCSKQPLLDPPQSVMPVVVVDLLEMVNIKHEEHNGRRYTSGHRMNFFPTISSRGTARSCSTDSLTSRIPRSL